MWSMRVNIARWLITSSLAFENYWLIILGILSVQCGLACNLTICSRNEIAFFTIPCYKARLSLILRCQGQNGALTGNGKQTPQRNAWTCANCETPAFCRRAPRHPSNTMITQAAVPLAQCTFRNRETEQNQRSIVLQVQGTIGFMSSSIRR